MVSVQQAGYQDLPHEQDGVNKGQNGTQTCSSGKEQKQQQEEPRQNCLLAKAEMVGHIDRRDLAAAVAHNDERLISGGKQLILRH